MTFRLALFFAAWYGSGSVEVVPADCPEGTCEDDSVLMQMGELHKRMSMDEKMAISNIIEKAFSHITGSGTYLKSWSNRSGPYHEIEKAFEKVDGLGEYFAHDIKEDATWQKCTSINWTKVATLNTVEGKLELPSVKAMLQELELEKCWCPSDVCNDDTCKAVRAAIDVATLLANSEYDPVFANYSVTSWGYYPSWVIGSVMGLDYSLPLPLLVNLKFPKGVIGYAVCDLLRVILTQSADQMSTGTCSYVASLAALTRHAPAKIIKVATRLFWTGMITPSLGLPCEGILHQQPGLVPFKTSTGYAPDFYSSAEGGQCFGNAGDCKMGAGRPQQNIGLTFSWTQSLISIWMKQNYGFCAPNAVRAGIVYPGQSRADAAEATRNQGGWYNSMVWECKNLLDIHEDSSCHLVMNPEVCPLGVENAGTCFKKWEMEPAFELQQDIFQDKIIKYRSEAFEKGILGYTAQQHYVVPKLLEEFAAPEHKILLDYVNFLLQLSSETQISFLQLNEIGGPPYPSFREEELKKVCKAKINMLIIDATVLQIAFSNPEIIYQLRVQGRTLEARRIGRPSCLWKLWPSSKELRVQPRCVFGEL
ncbi:unnamed protein product [Durusdinium trenchii]|uniref:Uncharacterized protein n=1 Tax=Durusdinium trenchii TaxID=1381693 RepID=A0ABP0PXA7_9DINO